MAVKKCIQDIVYGRFFEPLVMKIIAGKLNHSRSKKFCFQGQEMNYFIHSYNNVRSWGFSERTIEIPIVKFFLDEIQSSNVMEIGNVTKHYYAEFKDYPKVVLDKYELACDVINLDIVDFYPDEKFDFIYSISTFEHMDSDGNRNPDYRIPINEKFSSVAFENIDHVLRNVLNKGGKLLITIPLGYCNREVDRSIFSGELNYFEVDFKITAFRRVNGLEWVEVDLESLRNFSPKQDCVHALCVIEFSKSL